MSKIFRLNYDWPHSVSRFFCIFAILVSGRCFAATEIWSIGKCDSSYEEFIAPKDHGKVARVFPGDIDIDLRSKTFDVSTGFPWLLPGPQDVWAGSKSRTIRIEFDLEATKPDVKAYVLEILATAQNPNSPLLEVDLNGQKYTQQTQPGKTGDAILSNANGAVWTPYRFVFPAGILRSKDNELKIRSSQGSWLVFDRLRFSSAFGNVTEIGLAPLSDFACGEDGKPVRFVKVDFCGEILVDSATLRLTELDSKIPVKELDIPKESYFEGLDVSLELDPARFSEELKIEAFLVRKRFDGSVAETIATKATLPKVSKPWVDEIVLVFKTHFDIGYTKMASEVIENYRTNMIDNALAVVDASESTSKEKKFVWTLSGWPTATILKDQTPQRTARLDRALREGRFAVHALPFTTHTETLAEEDLVRGLRFSTAIAEKFGFSLPTDAKMTDVPCHSWLLPTLLAHAGVTFMHEGSNSGCSDPEVPVLYFREGPDGSRVLTMHVNGYGSGLEPPAGWPYRTWLWLIHTGDNHGPPRPGEVEDYLKAAQTRFPRAKIHIGRLSDFGNAILAKEDVATIPVVKGDMPDTWIHGPMCDPQGQRLARTVHEALTYAEMFETLYGKTDKSDRISESARKIADAREQSLLYGEHTWGGAIYWVGNRLLYGDQWKALENGKKFSKEYRRLVDSWEEHSDYIRRAAKACLPEGLREGEPGDLFNPLSWDLVDYRGRTLAPGAVVRNENPSPERVATSEITEKTSIRTSYFALTVEPKTGEISLDDLKNKRTLFRKTEQPTEVNPGFFYQRADAALCEKFMRDYCIAFPGWILNDISKRGLPSDVPGKSVTPEKIKRVVAGPDVPGVSKMIRIEYEPGEDLPFDALAMEIVLYENRPEIRFTFDGKAKKPDTWPETGYFCFPLAIENPRFRLGRLGGIVDPQTDIVRGTNRHLQWIRTGVAVFGEDGYGVGVCPLDAPLVSLDEPGCWRFSKDFVPKKANLWFNLFNNQWTTNFRFWNEGDIRASFILWTFDHYDNERSLVTPSLEAFALNFQPDYPKSFVDAALAERPQGIRIDRKGIYVTAFGADPDTGEMMLRMWEMAGRGTDQPAVNVSLPDKIHAKSVQLCDLRGRPQGGPIPVVNGTFRIDVKPYTPVNLRITL